MVFNATFNNISVILWQSVLLGEETEKTIDLSQVTDKLYHQSDDNSAHGSWGSRGGDRLVVGFTTCAISAYHP
jgi:hypothetical protein